MTKPTTSLAPRPPVIEVPVVRPPRYPVLIAIVVAAFVGAGTVTFDRPGLGWLLAGAAVVAVAGVTAIDYRTRPARTRYVWAGAALLLVAVGTVRAADWLSALCLPVAACCAVQALTGRWTVRAMGGLLVSAWRAGPWLGAAGRRLGPPDRVRASARIFGSIVVSALLLVVFGALLASADARFDLLLDRLTGRRTRLRGQPDRAGPGTTPRPLVHVQRQPLGRPRALIGPRQGIAGAGTGEQTPHMATAPNPRTPPESGGGSRVRVVMADVARTRSDQRTRVELTEQSPVGEALVRGLVRTQLALALRLAAVVGVGLGGLPLLFAIAPAVATARPFGISLPWLLLGFVAYPFLALVGWAYVHLAERTERDFTNLVERPEK